MATVTGSAALTGIGTASLSIYSSWSDRPYMMLNNDFVTDHGRQSSLSRSQRGVKSVLTTRGHRNHWYPRDLAKVSMSVNWNLLPDDSTYTFDGRKGRVHLKSLADSSDAIRLYIKDPSSSGYIRYDVYVASYQEELVMRRNFAGGVLYNISMEFIEL
tara:strand:- start:291 stop:764 length:474 start_codon:yes stop_codon:yes gene_type:complete